MPCITGTALPGGPGRSRLLLESAWASFRDISLYESSKLWDSEFLGIPGWVSHPVNLKVTLFLPLCLWLPWK